MIRRELVPSTSNELNSLLGGLGLPDRPALSNHFSLEQYQEMRRR
jgi:hypothetical protein